jgi:thiol-disulfide isomerase/thioredoxin
VGGANIEKGPGGSGGQPLYLRVGASYAYSQYPTTLHGTEVADDPLERSIELHMARFTVEAFLRSQTSFHLGLPVGALTLDSVVGSTEVEGLGDFDFRVRQDLAPLWADAPGRWPQVGISVGFVAPTGELPKPLDVSGSVPATLPGVDASSVTTLYASLGQGAWWFKGEVDVLWPIVDVVAAYVSAAVRTPFDESSEGVVWGPEVMSRAGALFHIVPGWFDASLTLDHLWRDQTEERHDGHFEVIANSGGHWLTATPNLRVTFPYQLALNVTGRIPLWEDVEGFQLVERWNVSAGLTWTFGVGEPAEPAHAPAAPSTHAHAHASPAPPEPPAAAPAGVQPVSPEVPVAVAVTGGAAFEPADIVVSGYLTAVDWFAEWCEPCHKLSAELEAAAARCPELRVRKVDIVDWNTPAARTHLTDVEGLPVLDLYDETGALIVRIGGDETFAFAEYLPERFRTGCLSAP